MAIKFHNNGNLKVTDLDETQSDIKFKDDEGLECADFEEGSGDDGLVGYWKMDDNLDTTNVIDSSGEGNHGTFSDANGNPNTSAHSVTGQVNRALEFDGVDDYVNCGNRESIQFLTENFSMEIWMKYKEIGYSGFNAGIHKGAGTGSNGYSLFAEYNKARTEIKSAESISPYSRRALGGTSNVNDGEWHHIVSTVDRGGYMKLYVDGDWETSRDISSYSGLSLYTTTVLKIGRQATFYSNTFIDEARLYNRVLPPTEIKKHSELTL